jgi:hypothetical protein
MILKFKITKGESSHFIKRLEIRWDFPLKKGGPTQQEMRRTLETLHGVEFVDFARYTCVIGYAEHVIDPSDLAYDIAETLEDDKEILHVYNKTEARPEYGAAERIEVEGPPILL